MVPKGKAVSATSVELTFPPWNTKMAGDGPVNNYTVLTRKAFFATSWIRAVVTDLNIWTAAVTVIVAALEVDL